ncbi:MAG: CHAT domain-containing protein, partial [Saprospiraceae bacterium]|nr:CHAT domain-containing protein [Saprospiraceae bacterium]
AEQHYLKALELSESWGGRYNIYYLKYLNFLINIYSKMGKDNKAWYYVDQAITINTGLKMGTEITEIWRDSLQLADCISVKEMLLTMNYCYHLLVSDSTQKKECRRITEVALYHLDRNRSDFLGDEDNLRRLEESHKWTGYQLGLLDQRKEADLAFMAAERNKSVLLLQAVSTTKNYSFGDLPDSVAMQERFLKEEYSGLSAALLEDRPEEEKKQMTAALTELNVEINRFRLMLEEDYPKYNKLKQASISVEPKEVQQLLEDKMALLEYVVGDSSTYIFYIDQENVELKEVKINFDTLTQKIRKLYQQLSNYNFTSTTPEKDYWEYASTAYWFYQKLLLPVLEDKEGIEHLVIIPDGELGHLPFEVFLTQLDSTRKYYNKLDYLLKKYKISYNYSAGLWIENYKVEEKIGNGEILGIAANYKITLDSSKKHNRLPAHVRLRELLRPLPAARREVETLQKKFQGDFFFDKSASERLFKEKAAQYSVLHLAMHGLLNTQQPILSSMAFSEDSDSLENNFLQAHEISKMKLNAQLIVLSACETGYGRFEKGNGIASLARAFMYAGAPSTVVSLWAVNDNSTALVMEYFYEGLASGLDKATALQQAKLKYIESTEKHNAHPSFWSPFVQIGNHQPIKITNKNSGEYTWGIGLGALLLLGTGLGVRKMRKKEA